jgi:class 3 adenylate cyclase
MKPSRELRDIALGLFHDFANNDPIFAERFSRSDGVTLIGTDPEEFIVGGPEARALLKKQLEEIKRQLEGLGRLKLEPGTILAYEEGTVGWAVNQITGTFPDGTSVDTRSTLVFHREDGEWQVVHMHWSIGHSNPEALRLELTTAIDEVAELIERERPELTSVASRDGTVTIMFTDLEASTATNEALGDDAFLPLLLRHNEIVQRQTASAGGTVVKSQGDGFMLAFPSARRGVECAIAVQQEVSAVDVRLKVRIGLHTGEPVRRADDFYGRDVAYAARIGSTASGGEILVSALVKSLVEPSGSVFFDGPRELDLKGFDGPQPVYSVTW